MFREFDLVALTHDIEEYGLKSEDVGTIVHSYVDKNGFEVEFVTAEGKTIAVLTLAVKDIRSFDKAEILHVRNISN